MRGGDSFEKGEKINLPKLIEVLVPYARHSSSVLAGAHIKNEHLKRKTRLANIAFDFPTRSIVVSDVVGGGIQ